MLLILRGWKWRVLPLTRSYASKPGSLPHRNAVKLGTKYTPKASSLENGRSDSQTLKLPDGRLLGFSTYGPPNGSPLLIFHGFPGSRIDAKGMVDKRMGIRVIGIDRPGMGLSTFQKNRRLVDWAQDVLDLTKYLGIERFRVLGGSAGGAYALACAKMIPKATLRAVGVASGFAPMEAGLVNMSPREWYLLQRPSLLRLVSWWRIGRHVNSTNSTSRRKVLRKMAMDMGVSENNADTFGEILAEPWRQGVRGYVEEAMVLQRDWGFDLRDVEARNVLLWYGANDSNTPVEMGQYMAERLNGSSLKIYPGVDHFTLMANHGNEIIKKLMQTG